MGIPNMPKADAAEIQSKLVAAIRQIAELEEKVEQCEKKSKELSADVERRGRQTFYLDRNLETREREIQELNRQMYTLEGKADPEDFEALRDDQDMSISRLQRKAEQLKGDLAKKQAEEKSSKDEAKQHVRYLEQYRTDSIFRIFGLKAHCKVLEEKIESQQGINKLASSIGV